MVESLCPTCDREGSECPTWTVRCANYPDSEPGSCCRACAPWRLAWDDCRAHRVDWRAECLSARADRDRYLARAEAAEALVHDAFSEAHLAAIRGESAKSVHVAWRESRARAALTKEDKP